MKDRLLSFISIYFRIRIEKINNCNSLDIAKAKMSKFRSIAKLVATTERMQKSLKKERFEILKNDVKARRQSVAVIPDGDLNSKYEQDAAMESDMQKLYNARFVQQIHSLAYGQPHVNFFDFKNVNVPGEFHY